MRKILFLFILLFTTLPTLANLENGITGVSSDTMEQKCAFNDINYQEAVIFIKKLQVAVRANDKNALADMMRYPLAYYYSEKYCTPGRTPYWVKNKAVFLQKYNLFMNQYVKDDILGNIFINKSENSNKNFGKVFCDSRGATTGNAAIHFDGKPLKVFEISTPLNP